LQGFDPEFGRALMSPLPVDRVLASMHPTLMMKFFAQLFMTLICLASRS
jgi:hypothetical protein